MNLLSLSPEQFESMAFDIVTMLGLRNTVWRTPGSDVGRDIEGDYFISDLSGQYQRQKWYVECKRYTGSVDWPTVWNKISYAEAQSADMLLFVTSSSLTPQAVDQVRIWNESRKKPTIRFWGAVEVAAKLNLYPELARKYGLKSEVASKLDIFYPSILLLIKTSNALSPDTGPIPEIKLWLAHSVSELVSTRMSDVKVLDEFYFRTHNTEDQFEWIDYSGLCVKYYDRFSIRALFAYLLFIFKGAPVITQGQKLDLVIELPRALIESEENHIQALSGLSNFSAQLGAENISLSVIKKAV
ncbi:MULTISPECIES: restriction endonuclease [unclassified Pseudomonas]|uniref:restriction endonuclease n=1 Tax=unclassified Pseudomonas TaxID=196821 RepID=UPI0005FCC9B5|nr:restriction endonuclease [Pseudomonas sp. St29]BAQ80695.1 uncharacterized protein PST29_2806 [Pseudomonas sp. St29]